MKGAMTKSDVQRVFKEKTVFHSKYFFFKKSFTSLKKTRVAFAFSRKKGSAVLRNRFKRRIRELTRSHINEKLGVDILCIAKTPLKNVNDTNWPVERQKIIGFCEGI